MTQKSDSLTAAERLRGHWGPLDIPAERTNYLPGCFTNSWRKLQARPLFTDSLPTGSFQREEMNGQSPPN